MKTKLESKIYNALKGVMFKDKTKDDYTSELINIADEHAVEFAEWVRKETYYEHLTKEFIYKHCVYKSEKELLETYKKEFKI